MSSAPSKLYKILYDTATKALLSHSQDELRSNIRSLSANLSQDCRRFFAPAAYMIALGENDGLTNEAYEKLVAWQITIVEKWSVEITEVLIDETKRSAMIWGKYTSTLKEPAQTFHLEFVQVLHMNESGTSVDKVVEFLDTAEAKQFDDALQQKKG